MATVTLKNLSKSYRGGSGGDVAAVANASIEVGDREFVVLLGRAASGKSSILRMIAGLEEPSSGDILIGDRRVNDVAPRDRDVALVTAGQAFYPAMSVRENMAFGLKLRKFKETEIKRRIEDAAAVLAIEPLLDAKPDALPRAQRQRVAIAQALVRQPKVLLLDEPLARLNPEARGELRTEIAKLHQRLTTTIIYATADAAEAMTLADRVAVLHDGTLQQADKPEALYRAPGNMIVAAAIGTPPMNLVHGILKQDRDGVRFIEAGDGSIEITLPLGDRPGAREFAGKPVVLGFRPEDISVAEVAKGQGSSAGTIPAVAEIVEPMGAETLLHLQTGAHTIFCRSEGVVLRSEAGRRMRFFINPAKIHLFDSASGQAW